MSQLFECARRSLPCGEDEYLASLNRYTLLVIDDMGIERESQYTIETIYTVIDERYKSGKPLIITTNIQLDILGNPQDLEHARIYDRIMERCMPVFFGGKNYRFELGKGNRDMAKRILTGAYGTVWCEALRNRLSSMLFLCRFIFLYREIKRIEIIQAE